MLKKYCFVFVIIIILSGMKTVHCDEWYDSYLQIYDVDLSENFNDYTLNVEEFADVFGLKRIEQADAKVNITLRDAAEIICSILPGQILYYDDPVENLNALGIIVGDENGINPDSNITYAQALIINSRVERVIASKKDITIMLPYGSTCEDENNGGYISDFGHDGIYHFNADGEMNLICDDKWARFLNFCGDDLTYLSHNEVKTFDINSGESIIHDNSVYSEVYRDSNSIYYIKNGLIRCDAITNEKTVINAQVDGSFYIIYNYAYYIVDDKLYRSTLDGSISEYICNVYSEVLDTSDNKIYYIDEHCNLSFVDFALKTYETVYENEKTLSNAYKWPASAMCVNDGIVFFSTVSIGNCNIYALDLNNKELEHIEQGYSWFDISSDKLIYDFWNYDDSGEYVHEISIKSLSEL